TALDWAPRGTPSVGSLQRAKLHSSVMRQKRRGRRKLGFIGAKERETREKNQRGSHIGFSLPR
ncbi:MAG: hypothetical protein V3S73_01675, partial [Gammaproteobacteria bacterium]